MSELPHSFDRFHIVRILGKGGMGTVYLAKDERLGRQVAIKVLNADEVTTEERRGRFLREAKTAAAIRHQNIATIYEVGETDDGLPYIVMEYCEGETLAQRMRRRPLDSGEFLNIARQMAAGVTAAHDSGVIHRDLKVANIIIEPTGLVKILDFGLAKPIGGEARSAYETTAGQFFGTLHYVSPEQARGLPADERSDLFSLGIVFYQMASGQLPFNGDAPLVVLEKIRDNEPEPFVPLDSSFPHAASKIIGRLLQKDPAHRYQSARDLLADLEGIDTPTLRITASHSRSAIGRTLPRPRAMQAVIVLAALAIVTVAVVLTWRHGTREAKVATAAATMPIRSMAVLPLDNIANNTRDEFLSVGLADALVTKLQQVPSLQVRPTSAVMQFHNKKTDVKSASEKLQVDGILEGRFLAAGDLVRVNLQLTDARTGYSVWADSVDGKRANLLQLIDDVSTKTVSALNDKLGIQQTAHAQSDPRSANPKAYEEYLRARALNGSFQPQEFAAQIAALKHAIELDPSFAAAYADLAVALSLAQARGLAVDAETMKREEWYAHQAVRIDPNLAASHLALGRVFVRDPERFRESVRENLAALRLNPADPTALHTVVTYFVSAGDLRKAQCVGDRLIAVDPSSNEAKTRGYWYINAVDPDGALQNADVALQSKETELFGHDVRALSFIMLGKIEDAEKEADIAAKLAPNNYIGRSLKAMIATERGDRAAAEAYLKAFEPDAQRFHWAALRQSMCYAKLGDREKAVEWLKHSASLGNHSWYALVKHPWLASLQSDPEVQTIVGTMKKDLDDVSDDVAGVTQGMCR